MAKVRIARYPGSQANEYRGVRDQRYYYNRMYNHAGGMICHECGKRIEQGEDAYERFGPGGPRHLHGRHVEIGSEEEFTANKPPPGARYYHDLRRTYHHEWVLGHNPEDGFRAQRGSE